MTFQWVQLQQVYSVSFVNLISLSPSQQLCALFLKHLKEVHVGKSQYAYTCSSPYKTIGVLFLRTIVSFHFLSFTSLSACLSVCLSVSLSLSLLFLFPYLSVSPPFSATVFVKPFFSVSLSSFLSVSVSFSLSLSLCFFLCLGDCTQTKGTFGCCCTKWRCAVCPEREGERERVRERERERGSDSGKVSIRIERQQLYRWVLLHSKMDNPNSRLIPSPLRVKLISYFRNANLPS